MTRGDAQRLFARLLVAYPGIDLAEPTIELWLERLERHPIDVGLRAVDDLIDTHRRFPSIAAFNEATARAHDAQRRARTGAPRCNDTPELDEPPVDRAPRAAEWIATARATLAASKPLRAKAQPVPVPGRPLCRDDEPRALGDGLETAVAELDRCSTCGDAMKSDGYCGRCDESNNRQEQP